MKNIKLKYGKATFTINKEWASGFKVEGDFLKAMEGKLSTIPEPKRTEILKETFAGLQPKEEAPAPTGKKEKQG